MSAATGKKIDDTLEYSYSARLDLLNVLLDKMLTISADVMMQTELSGDTELFAAAEAMNEGLVKLIEQAAEKTNADGNADWVELDF